MTKRDLAVAIAVGVGIAAPFAIRGEVYAALFAAAVGSLVFGLLQNIVLTRIRSRLGRFGPVPEVLPIRPELTLRVAADPADIARAITKAVPKLARGAKIQSSGDALSLEGGIPQSIRHGYGEVLTVSISQENHQLAQVRLRSRPRARGVLVDYGRNLSNVQQLRSALEHEFGSDAVSVLALTDQSEAAS